MGLRIGFDLDGTLCEIDIGLLRVIDNMEGEAQRSAEEWYYRERKPLLNARLFLHPDDKMFIVTSRPKRLEKWTKQWVLKYYPLTMINLYIVNYPTPKGNTEKEVNGWLENKQKHKANILNQLKLDVYIDDDVQVPILRKYCPNIKIIQYGGRI